MKHLLLLLLAVILSNCTKIASGGGGADVGNPTMVGVVLSSNREARANVEVYLLPSDYIHIGDSIESKYKTVTDAHGRYSFTIIEENSYTLSAKDTLGGEYFSFFRKGVTSAYSGTFYDILEESVSLVVRIPPELTNIQSTLVMSGMPAPLSYQQVEFQGEIVWYVENLPQGDIAELYLLDSSGIPEQLTDSLVLNDDSIQVIESYIEWHSYSKVNTPLSEDVIYEVFCDSRGVEWFGTFGGGAFRGDTWEQYSESQGLPSSVVLAIQEDQNGVIWCGTAKGVALINGHTVNPLIGNGAPTGSVFDIYCDANNIIWLGTSNGLYQYDQGVWNHFTPDNSGLSDTLIYSVTGYDTILYVGSFGGGINTLDQTGWDTLTRENSGLSSNHIYELVIDSKGELWAGTTKGISHKSGNGWTIIDEGNSELPNNAIWSLAIDQNGVVWAGTTEGTIEYHDGVMQIYSPDNSRFTSPLSYSIHVESSTGVVLFGTDSGVVEKRRF